MTCSKSRNPGIDHDLLPSGDALGEQHMNFMDKKGELDEHVKGPKLWAYKEVSETDEKICP